MYMKSTLLDGAVDENPTLQAAAQIIVEELEERGVEVVRFELRKIEIAPCQGCFGCWVKTPGRCLVEDASWEITENLVQSGLAVLLTPVTFGGYSSELKKALDRAIGCVSPSFTKIAGETHHRRRYPKSPKLLGIGINKPHHREDEQIFKTLVSRNALNLHSPAWTTAVLTEGITDERITHSIAECLSELEL